MMAAAERQGGHDNANKQALIAKYRGKFPEIPEQILVKTVQEHGDDLESCEKILEGESKKCLYGSSPTPEVPVPPIKGLTPKSDPLPTLDFIRSNSTGSAGSSHSSGRSTPVNPIPTPWVVPKYHPPTSAGHPTNHYPGGSVPSGMVYPPINGNYYYPPWSGAGHHIPPITPLNVNTGYPPLSSGQQRSPGEGYPLLNDSTQAPVNRVNRTSPNTGYPVLSTSSQFPMSTSTNTGTTLTNHTSPVNISPSRTTGASGVPLMSPYYTLPNNQPGYMYFHPVGTGSDQLPFIPSSSAPFDGRYQTLPTNAPHIQGPVMLPTSGTRTETPNSGFIPVSVHPLAAAGTGHSSERLFATNLNNVSIPGENVPYTGSTLSQFENRYPPVGNVLYGPGQVRRMDSPNLATNVGFVPINPSVTVTRSTMEPLYSETQVSGLHSSVIRQGSLESSNRMQVSPGQPVANDEYLRVCLSQQQKRIVNLRKEYDIEKERLQLLIREISDRDHDLYNRRYRVEPNPTAEQLQRLKKANDELNRVINDISKNLDRLDNGQAVLKAADPQIYSPQRFSPGTNRKVPDHYDRSNSVPCPYGGAKPHLTRPLSEHDLNINFEQERVHYRLTPPKDSSLEDWSLVNQEIPIPFPNPNTRPVNIDEGGPWNCSQCTFLNHESLLVCEMCGNDR